MTPTAIMGAAVVLAVRAGSRVLPLVLFLALYLWLVVWLVVALGRGLRRRRAGACC